MIDVNKLLNVKEICMHVKRSLLVSSLREIFIYVSYVFRYGALLYRHANRVANTYPVIKTIDATLKAPTVANGYELCIMIIYDGRICISRVLLYIRVRKRKLKINRGELWDD